jgi:RimJ/RimL family protein N-acetyltransferase
MVDHGPPHQLPIGDSGLLLLKEYGWIDLGFRLAQSHWGKGLATAAALAWVRAAFNRSDSRLWFTLKMLSHSAIGDDKPCSQHLS